MQIELQGHVKSDGSLDLHLETGLPESVVKVLIQIAPAKPIQTPLNQGWPEGYFEELYGCMATDPLLEPEELPIENRELLS
ncbi:MAG: hypothetical protein AB7I41_23550 [Candidatus Sericytochromatia bacterium]